MTGALGSRRLVVVAHGTRLARGNEVARAIARRCEERSGMPAAAAYVELSEPTFADVAAGGRADEEVVAVPLLLSRGYHVGVDLPAAARRSPGRLVLTPPLGPHPLLARALAARLREAGAEPGAPVVLVAAGSRDPEAARDLGTAADLLGEAWGADVRLAVMAGSGPRPPEVVRPGDAVATYLLAPGYFADLAAAQAREAGACVIADVLGDHDLVVEAVLERAAAALG